MKKILLTISTLVTVMVCAQNYQYLGDYTSNGTPLYLEEPGDEVSIATLEMISNSLPESYPVPDYNPHYISSGYETDVVLDEQADVWVTFVDEGAGYRNVLGFYTYDADNPPTTAPQDNEITIIFPNASALGSGGGLQVGDKVKIGTFPAGTGIGWVLLANAWSSNAQMVGYGLWKLYSNPDYNPEADEALRYHNVLLNDPDNERIILGFEDIRRDYGSCDNDFNDAIFYVTASPYEAIRTNNYADVSSASSVTSAYDGGLESNGDLASLVAKRNFRRRKSGVELNQKALQTEYHREAFQMMPTDGTNTLGLSECLPDTGMYSTETAYVSSPDDLIGITNANEVFSVDLYSGETRVAAILATATNGAVYDHTKVICDRLNNSSLEDVRTVRVRGHQIISSKLRRATGELEFTLSFSVQLGDATNQLYSFWNIAQYPEGDYYNFQLWGSSFSQVFAAANYIMDTLSNEKPLLSETLEDVVPPVFVKSGYYANGAIHLDVINKTGASTFSFNGSIATTEVSERHNMTQSVALNGDWNQTVAIPTGRLFDIGMSLSTTASAQQDALYLADGPWGLDYLEELAQINYFNVTNDELAGNEDAYEVERQPAASGMVKGNVNLFRHLLPGDQSLNVTSYNSIQFTIKNTSAVELVIVPEGLTDWNQRLRYTIAANSEATDYSIAFSDFEDGSGNTVSIDDIKTVVFSVIGDYASFQPFDIEVSNMAFSAQSTLGMDEVTLDDNTLKNYPNPFKHQTTIRLPESSASASIQVYDMLGRVVDSKELIVQYKKAVYTAPQLSKGMYKYMLKDENNKTYSGTFMVD